MNTVKHLTVPSKWKDKVSLVYIKQADVNPIIYTSHAARPMYIYVYPTPLYLKPYRALAAIDERIKHKTLIGEDVLVMPLVAFMDHFYVPEELFKVRPTEAELRDCHLRTMESFKPESFDAIQNQPFHRYLVGSTNI